MSLLRAAGEWFLEPAEPTAAERVGGGPRSRVALAAEPPRIAVLGSPTTVPPLAAAVALEQRRRARTGAALLALWRTPPPAVPPLAPRPPAAVPTRAPRAPAAIPAPARGAFVAHSATFAPRDGAASPARAVPAPAVPALPAAAALASRLARRGLPAVARGRLVWLVLDLPPYEAVETLRRAEAAADVPSVLALARPRDATVDAALAERDLLIVAAAPDSPLATAALADLSELGVPVRACAPPAAGLARFTALAGLTTQIEATA